jgi:hypothetical protein
VYNLATESGLSMLFSPQNVEGLQFVITFLLLLLKEILKAI